MRGKDDRQFGEMRGNANSYSIYVSRWKQGRDNIVSGIKRVLGISASPTPAEVAEVGYDSGWQRFRRSNTFRAIALTILC